MERCCTALGSKNRIEKLGCPGLVAVLSVIGEAVFGRVPSGDMRRSEDDVPKKK
jgi:hypothetical protein